MSIVRGVYEGLTAITYSLILDVIMKVLLLMGFTDIVYDLLQLITAILWIGIGMFGWNNVCISSARLERPGAKAPRKADKVRTYDTGRSRVQIPPGPP